MPNKKSRLEKGPFADQGAFVKLVEASAAEAVAKAVAENDALGIPSPGRGPDGNIVFRLRGKTIAAEND